MKELTPKQELFCQEYAVNLNGTQAAIKAGYSKKTAQEQSSRLLSNVMVQQRIAELKKDVADELKLNAKWVLERLMQIADVDLEDLYDENGNLKHVSMIPKHTRKAIAAIDVFEEFEGIGRDREQIGQTKKVKFWDKTKALEALGKHLKLFTDKIELSATDELAEKLMKARKRKGL